MALFGFSLLEVLEQRIQTRAANVRVLIEIPGGVKQLARITTFRRSMSKVVQRRIYASGPHIGIVIEIPVAIE
jgi:hypothetical protein